jgi:cytidylate kinase
MAIITISRGSASGGLLLANALGERLGYEVIGREEIVKYASQFGAPEEELREALLRPPSFWERLKHTRRRYLAFVQFALCERVQRDGVIYHGNAGHLLLRGVPHLLCVRLIAPIDFRVRQLMEKQNLGREEALASIETVDRERHTWTRLVYGEDPLNPDLYDMIINLKILTVDSAAEMVAAAVARPELATTDQGRKAVADLLLASRVKAVLAADPKTASTEVRVEAQDGVVTLAGKLHSNSLVESVLEIAAAVEGVKQINRDNLDAPDYTV